MNYIRKKKKVFSLNLFVILGLLVFCGAKCSSRQSFKNAQDLIWYHISEKDEEEFMFFQKESDDMPMGRREGFVFKTGGEFEWLKLGPNDKRATIPGQWEIIKGNDIEVAFKDKSIENLQIKIVSLERDSLKLLY